MRLAFWPRHGKIGPMRIPSPLRSQKGSMSFEFFVGLFLAGLLILSFFLVSLSWNRPAAVNAAPAAPVSGEDLKLGELDEQIYHLYQALGDVETMRNTRKYLGIVKDAVKKIIRSDYLWEKKTRSKKGIMSGMAAGLNEVYEARFTTNDKFTMLSKKYGLSPSALRRLKADFEIMFMDEYADKFSGSQDAASPEEKEDSPSADPKTGKT